jgi:membrane protease YdiL (CAAX protease family)
LNASMSFANPVLLRQDAHRVAYELFTELAITVPFLALLIFAVKTDALALFRRSLNSPPIVTLLLAVAFPMIVGSIPGLIQFVVARVRWAQSGYGREQPPTLLEQFGHFDWVLLLMIISALAEEIAWRGYLQPRLISRYGLYRGIFFVGIVWGAFHFPSDFSFNTHLIQFVLGFVGRLANCVAWGFVLSWLTLRAKGSVIPAGISHGLMNALYSMSWTFDISNWVIYFLWAALAVLLYWYWPPIVPAPEAAEVARDDEFRDLPDVEAGTA